MACLNITIINRQTAARPNLRQIKRLARNLMARAADLNPRRTWGAVSVVLTDNAGIMRLNRAYFESNCDTDVISLACPPMPGLGKCWSGEVIVNVQRAVQVGPRHGGADHELALYVAHGCDHLAGQDDRTAIERRRMRRRELEWLKTSATKLLWCGLV